MKRLARVMLVEDNPMDVELFRILLMEEAGIEMEFHHCPSSDECLKQLQQPSHPLPDILLLDVNMPRMDGFELLQELRSLSHLKKLAVSMLSTSEDAGDKQRARQHGAAHYMVKPADEPQFEMLVRAMPQLGWCNETNSKRLVAAQE